jgi:hypothetical protein
MLHQQQPIWRVLSLEPKPSLLRNRGNPSPRLVLLVQEGQALQDQLVSHPMAAEEEVETDVLVDPHLHRRLALRASRKPRNTAAPPRQSTHQGEEQSGVEEEEAMCLRHPMSSLV